MLFRSQTFRKFDPNNIGSISLKNFETILKELRAYQLSEFISTNLNEIVKNSSSNQINFAYFIGFLQLLSNVESMRKIYLAVHEKKSHLTTHSEISKEEFLTEAQHFPRTTPLQIDILFAISRLLHRKTTNENLSNDWIELNDFDLICANEHLLPYRLKSEIVDEHYKIEHQSVTMKILESLYRFALGKEKEQK